MSEETTPPSSEPGWWVAVKVAAFIAIPSLVLYLIKRMVE